MEKQVQPIEDGTGDQSENRIEFNDEFLKWIESQGGMSKVVSENMIKSLTYIHGLLFKNIVYSVDGYYVILTPEIIRIINFLNQNIQALRDANTETPENFLKSLLSCFTF